MTGITKGHTFIVAEISANHEQSFTKAVQMIKVAKKCGVDAVKFQTYTPDTVTIDVKNKYFMVKHPKWGGQTLFQLYKKTWAPWDWFAKLKKISNDLGLVFFSTVFDKTSVDFLEEVGVPFHKISSFELVDLPLIEYAASTKKPIILSTGMATFSEIQEAVSAAKKAGAKDITLLKCVSSYPADPREMNLRTIPDMKRRFRCPVGISDHTLGIATSVAAVSLGATMVEKHFTLSRKVKSPDSFFSIEPHELRDLVSSIRTAEKALGRIHYGLTVEEKKNRSFRRSLFAVKDIERGEILTTENIRSIRPSNGMPPRYFKTVLGKRAKTAIRRGTPLDWQLIG